MKAFCKFKVLHKTIRIISLWEKLSKQILWELILFYNIVIKQKMSM